MKEQLEMVVDGKLESLYPEMHAYTTLDKFRGKKLGKAYEYAHNALEQSIMSKARKLGFTGPFDKLIETPIVRERKFPICDNCGCEKTTGFINYRLDTLVEGKLTLVH